MALNLMHHNSCNSRIKFNKCRVKLSPSDDDLAECQALYDAIDMMICTRFNNFDEILFGARPGLRMWSWTVVTIGNHKIPAPIYTTSKRSGVLYDFLNREVEMSKQECAYLTTIYYLKMLRIMADQWEEVVEVLHPTIRWNVEPAVQWIQNLPANDYSHIIQSARRHLTDKGRQVLN